MSDMILSGVMRRLHKAQLARDGIGWIDQTSKAAAVPHGWRSTFRVWAAETGVPHDLAEICRAHDVGSAVERAYKRTDVLERRRDVMTRWGGVCFASSAPDRLIEIPLRGEDQMTNIRLDSAY